MRFWGAHVQLCSIAKRSEHYQHAPLLATIMSRATLLLVAYITVSTEAVCDGNPHGWGRLRRCDQTDAHCPSATWQGPRLCEGVGGLASSDLTLEGSFNATRCTPVATPEQLAAM